MLQDDNSLSRFPMVATAADAALLQPQPLSSAELTQLDAYWPAANYLAVGVIYLRGNPLLREALRPGHVKNRSWATGAPAQANPSSGPMPTD